MGALDLSHFEDANMNGVRIDWSCAGDSSRQAGEQAWERWDAWGQLGINGRIAQIAGTFLFMEQGIYVAYEDTLMISKIEYIRIVSGEDTEVLNNNPHLVMNCNYLRRTTSVEKVDHCAFLAHTKLCNYMITTIKGWEWWSRGGAAQRHQCVPI